MRQSYVAGNWKMHKTIAEAVSLANELAEGLKRSPNKLMVAPPFTALSAVGPAIAAGGILLGAQNMASELEGAHTGEISVRMLKDLGVRVAIIGHSERRHVYNESDELINQKVQLALTEGMEVILCVGETLDEREAGDVERVVGTQLRAGLSGVENVSLDQVTIAYEPVWAIGTGKTATPEDADAVHRYIRGWFAETYESDAAENIIVQYGGSVKPDNIAALMKMENIDGALVGGASLKAETFLPICRFND
ncbi:MAG: triose-phosphate isomerase [Spirochaetales bacterium]|nr:triose-phosphate isomerase [Spirochaetales bacterium]